MITIFKMKDYVVSYSVITSDAQFEVEENQSAIGSVLVYDPQYRIYI